MRRGVAPLLGIVLALVATQALALPRVGSTRPALTLVDGWERTLDLGHLGKPLLLLYEDKDDGKQNDELKADLKKLDASDHYRKAVAHVVVADVSAYDYWPVRGMVKDAVQKESNRAGVVIYTDFTGSIRTSLGLVKGQSNVVLYDRRGDVLFAHSGVLPADQRKQVVDLVRRQIGAP